MPAPRAVLADITDFKLDPKTPHTIVKAHGRLSSYTKNDASATTTIYVPVYVEPEPVVIEDVAPLEVLSAVSESAATPLELDQSPVELETTHHLPPVTEEPIIEPVIIEDEHALEPALPAEEAVETHVSDTSSPHSKKRSKKWAEKR